MKKILLFSLLSILLCSCSVQTYSYKGDVILMSDSGEILEQWNNATLQQGDVINGTYTSPHTTPYKNGGVELKTSQGEVIYINGGIILMRNIKAIAPPKPTKKEGEEETLVERLRREGKI
mgnify:CR=1 FL=1